MNDPLGLEPPNGDYVAYLNALQAGKIRSLEPLRAAEGAEIPAGGAVSRAESVLKRIARASLPGHSAPAPMAGSTAPQSDAIPGESPADRLRRRARAASRKQAAGALGGIAAFAGFTLFAIGGVTGNDWLFPLGMLVAVAGFSAAAKR